MVAKSYYQYASEISDAELFESLLAYGMFSEKLPPIFTSEDFYAYCLRKKPSFPKKWYGYVKYDSIRNSNVKRQLGIPHPFAYERLCKLLSDNWSNHLLQHFKAKTGKNLYKISRIHLRKMKHTKALFEMNYNSFRTGDDDSPENDLMIGKRCLVAADISTCFPSIYSHSIPWALVGKKKAKDTARKRNQWYNKIDSCVSDMKNGETHGVLIGPHASNLLSEIILTTVDSKLKKYSYTRCIDDYQMFAASKEEAERFLVDLAKELNEFDLILNQKKTEIVEMPAKKDEWVTRLKFFDFDVSHSKVEYPIVSNYLDLATEFTLKNNNASPLLYALKVLANKPLTLNAQQLCLKRAMHFSFLFPYIIPSLKQFVFDIYPFDKSSLKSFVNELYIDQLKKRNFEAVYYCLYFAITFDFDIEKLNDNKIISSNSCIAKVVLYLYCKKNKLFPIVKKLEDHAKNLNNENDFDNNWLFVYEVLDSSSFDGQLIDLKTSNVSFVRKEYHF